MCVFLKRYYLIHILHFHNLIEINAGVKTQAELGYKHTHWKHFIQKQDKIGLVSPSVGVYCPLVAAPPTTLVFARSDLVSYTVRYVRAEMLYKENRMEQTSR